MFDLSILLIPDYTLRLLRKLVKRKLQEVIHGQTPRIFSEMEGCPVQKLPGLVIRIEEFKR